MGYGAVACATSSGPEGARGGAVPGVVRGRGLRLRAVASSPSPANPDYSGGFGLPTTSPRIPFHKLLLGRDPVTGERLASQPRLSRFENGVGRGALYRMARSAARSRPLGGRSWRANPSCEKVHAGPITRDSRTDDRPAVGRSAGSLLRYVVVELRKLIVERYKGYSQRAEVELAPLTILVGPNNSGKTALAQAIQLLAGGMSPSGKDTSEPLPLESGGIQHGETFEDLVTGRAVHGWLYLSAAFADDNTDLSLSATIRNVMTPPQPSERQISDWSLSSGDDAIRLNRRSFDRESDYRVSVSGTRPAPRGISWRGLLPRKPDGLADWLDARVTALHAWGLGVRHLRCPRSLLASPFSVEEHLPMAIGPNGHDTPLALAADDELRESVREWYTKAFGLVLISWRRAATPSWWFERRPATRTCGSYKRAGDLRTCFPSWSPPSPHARQAPVSTSSNIRRLNSIRQPTLISRSSCSTTSQEPYGPWSSKLTPRWCCFARDAGLRKGDCRPSLFSSTGFTRSQGVDPFCGRSESTRAARWITGRPASSLKTMKRLWRSGAPPGRRGEGRCAS